MHNYHDFLLEAQFAKWDYFEESLDEGLDSFIESIQKFLDKEFEVNTKTFEETVAKLVKRFKGKIKTLTIIAGILLGGYMASEKLHSIMDNAGISKSEQETIVKEHKKKSTPKHRVIKIKKNEIKKFLHDFAQQESSGNPKSINSLGYIGKYQFGTKALEDVGLEHITVKKFRANPNIFPEHKQDEAMIKLLKLNRTYLGDYYTKYEDKVIAGVKITRSGILAGCHLVGNGAAKQFLDSNGRIIPRDGNDVPITEYIKKFGGYYLEL